jgi:hypothetical protein
VTLKDVARDIQAQIRPLERLKAKLAAQVIKTIKANPDLAARFRLLHGRQTMRPWPQSLRPAALARRKPPKLVIVAVMRKLIEAADLVLSRGQP